MDPARREASKRVASPPATTDVDDDGDGHEDDGDDGDGDRGALAVLPAQPRVGRCELSDMAGMFGFSAAEHITDTVRRGLKRSCARSVPRRHAMDRLIIAILEGHWPRCS